LNEKFSWDEPLGSGGEKDKRLPGGKGGEPLRGGDTNTRITVRGA